MYLFYVCCTLLYVHSSFAIILMGKRELVAWLSLSSWCLVIVVWLFLAVLWVCLQFASVVFPDHTHLQCLVLIKGCHIFRCVSFLHRGITFKKRCHILTKRCHIRT